MVGLNCLEILNATNDALFVHDETGRIIHVNEQTCSLYGYDQASALQCRIGDLSSGEPPYSEQEALEWMIRSWEAPQSFEWRAKRRSGELFWAEITLRSRQIEGSRRVVASVRDITLRKAQEKALRDSEFFLRKSQALARIGTYAFDVSTGHWVSSQTLDEIFGIDQSYPRSVESWLALIYPEDRAALKDLLINDVLARHQRFDREYRIIRHDDGMERWLYGTGELEFSDDGQPVRMIGTIQDITQHITANEELAESEQRFRNLVQNSGDIISVLDERGIRTYLSGPVEQIFGYSPEELIGRNAMEVIHPDDRGRVQKSLAQAMTLPGSCTRSEYRIQHRDGRWVFLEAVGTNLLHDPATRGIVLNVRDVSERKRAELASREKEERYRLVSELSGQLIHDYHIGTGQIEWAGRVEELTGYPLEEFNRLGFSGLESLVHPEDRPRVLLQFENSREKQTPYGAHYRLLKKDGTYIHVDHQGAFSFDEAGKPMRMLGSIKDETLRIESEKEQSKLQDQLQHAMKMEAVGRLAGGIAHDFNNLLTVISGNLELSKMELNDSDPLLSNLEEIEKAAHSAVTLTRQLLAFSRRQIFNPRVICINDLVHNLQRMLVRVIGEDISLKTRLTPKLGPVRVDPAQFEHVLVNLAVNSRDAMPSGGRLLIETENIELDETYCTTRPYVRPGPYVGLSVSDDGQGISDEVKRHIFEPFYTTKPVGKGTGLGLSMIFGVVKQSGGSIEVYSEVGLGTTFKIYLPRVDEPAEALKSEKTARNLPCGSETLLLVEDEAKVREIAYVLLRRLGYRVISASNGDEALMVAQAHGGNIDMVMTDVVMPGMNGRELAARLHGLYPQMKVLFTSGYAEGLFEQGEAPMEQMNFLGKPYALASLAKKIREVLAPK